MCSENYGTINELLVLEFDKERCKNKALYKRKARKKATLQHA